MKALLITPKIVRNDGQGRVNYEISRAALDAGIEMTFLVSRCAPEIANHPKARVVTYAHPWLPLELLRGMAFAVQSWFWLLRNRRTFDVVHTNGFTTWTKADINSVHFVHTAWRTSEWFPFRRWWNKPYFAYQVAYTRVYSWLERVAFRSSRKIVAVSNTVADELKRIGVPPGKVQVNFNGVDPTEFRPGQADRAAFGLPADVFLVLFSGDIKTPRKNVETVIRALSHAPDIHLAVAGVLEGSPYPELARTLGVQDRVHFLGFVKDMPNLMRSVDVFAFPSRYEACSLVLLEALASGLPVITAEKAGGAELVGKGGLLLKNPNDAVTLAEWLQALVENKERREEMGREGRRIALANTWTAMAARYLQLYEAVTHEGASAAG